MANYFVINNKFRPYSFDELIRPYQMYGEAYKEQEAAIDAAREKEFSPELLDKTLDEAAYNMYDQASKSLQSASDELATRGLSTSLRNRLKSTARNYKKTMEALNVAQAQLYAEREKRDKLGPDYVYQQDNLRIGDFLNGNTPNQARVSLSTIAKNIGTEFAAKAASISDTTWEKALSNGKQTGYYDVTTTQGLTSAQLGAILSDDVTWAMLMQHPQISKEEKAKLQEFRNVISAEVKAIGFEKYSPAAQQEISNAILRGAYAGLGATKHEYKKDAAYNPLGWARLEASKSKTGRGTSGAGRDYRVGTIHIDKKGNATITPPGAKDWKGHIIGVEFEGRIPTKADEISPRNVEIIARTLGMNPLTSAISVMEEADKRGILIQIKGKGDKQEVQLNGMGTIITGNNNNDDIDTSFDEDAV